MKTMNVQSAEEEEPLFLVISVDDDNKCHTNQLLRLAVINGEAF
jgi:hypothetical protein